MDEMLEVLKERQGWLRVALLTIMVITSLLGAVALLSDVHDAFQKVSPTLWGVGVGMALAIVASVASVFVLTRNRALYSARQRLLSVSLLGLMSVVVLWLLGVVLSGLLPNPGRWSSCVRHCLAVAGTISFLAVIWYERREVVQRERFRVLVTEFGEGASYDKPKDRTVTDQVLRALRAIAAREEGFEVNHLDEVVIDSRRARRLGENAQATVVVFGYFTRTASHVLLNIGFEVMKQPESYYPLSMQPRTVGIEELDSFDLHFSLAYEAVYLASFLLGMFKYSMDDYASAIGSLEQALEQPKREEERMSDAALRTYLGNALYYCGDIERAAQEYRAAVETDPEYAKAWHNLGVVHAGTDRYTEAAGFFSRAIDLSPDLLVAYWGRAGVQFILGDYDLAIADCSAVLREEPNNAEVLVLRASSYSCAGERDYALKDLRTALTHRSHDPSGRARVLDALVREHAQFEEFEEALKYCKELVWTRGSRSYAYGVMGDLFACVGDPKAAVKAYTKALASDAFNVHLFCARGKQYLDLKEFDRFREDYASALAQDSDVATAYYCNLATEYYNEGNTHAGQREFDRAIDCYTITVELESQAETGILPRVLLNRGQAFCAVEEYQKAVRDFSRCLEAGDVDDRNLVYRGYAFLGLQRFEDAVTDLRAAHNKQPESQKVVQLLAAAHYSLACNILENQGEEITEDQNTKAVYHLNQAVELDANFEERIRSRPDIASVLDLRKTPNARSGSITRSQD